MGTLQSLRKAYGALKDSTMVGLAKVNSEFKDLDIAIVKATNHVECPPKERHVRKIFAATSAMRPRADVAYCIHALARRLTKTRNWIVALKTLIVIHRALREGDPTFREELLNYSQRGHILQISNFKDDSSPLSWDCSAWVRTYALFLEERLECFRILHYDIEAEKWTKPSNRQAKGHSRTRVLGREELLEHLPALQQLLYRLIGCQPEGAAFTNYLIQYALALVLKESFKIYCAINDGIINLMDMYFEMTRHDAIKALNIYKRAGQQAENLAEFYEFSKGLELARNFQFPTLRQPPPSCLATMEEYIREAPRVGSVSNKRLEYREREEVQQNQEHPSPLESEKPVEEEIPPMLDTEEPPPKVEEESHPAPTEDTGDLLGLNEINPAAAELEESNALALAIVPPGDGVNHGLPNFGDTNSSGWELALVTHPSSNTTHVTESKLAGGFDRLLLDSLYEDDVSRRQQQQNLGYGVGMSNQNPFDPHDPFSMSNNIAPPPNVQMALMAQQHQQQMLLQQQQQMMMGPQQYPPQYPQQQQYLNQYPQPQTGSANPFGDPFSGLTQSSMPQGHGNHNLI
ncbi:hypothetical protein IFM89_006837 [Coptis chinensis]|uniref:ENTH domain-containing protein n=1 Tax=Coptis chinensis TaxID=261450 RepID=A0A835M1V9_9MAGN|nr:hypothetical protein IFM89_006837 [Coptis chinensis]